MFDRATVYFRTFFILFWIQACLNFVCQELLPLPEKVNSIVQLMFDPIYIMLGFMALRSAKHWVMLIAFVSVAFFSTVMLNRESSFLFLNGIRDFSAMLFIPPIAWYLASCSKGAQFKESFNKQLRVFLWIQAFCMTWQFLKYGAFDEVGGSLGAGYSGIMSTLIYISSFYLVNQNWDVDNIKSSIWRNKEYIFLLYPTMLNETKISFVYLLIYACLLVKFDAKYVFRMLFAAPVIVFMLVGIYQFYLWTQPDHIETIESDTFVEDYLTGGMDADQLIEYAEETDLGYLDEMSFGVDLPRFLKNGVVWEIMDEPAGGRLFGAGIGHFKGGTLVKESRFYSEHEWILSGTIVMLQFLFIQLGFIGCVWYFLWLISWVFPFKSPTPASRRIKIFVIIQICIIFFYDPTFRFVIPTAIIYLITSFSSFNYLQEKDEEQPVAVEA